MQLSKEADIHDQVLEDITKNIEGFTKEQFEQDTVHYKMNRIFAE